MAKHLVATSTSVAMMAAVSHNKKAVKATIVGHSIFTPISYSSKPTKGRIQCFERKIQSYIPMHKESTLSSVIHPPNGQINNANLMD